jgi:hypothetical protein
MSWLDRLRRRDPSDPGEISPGGSQIYRHNEAAEPVLSVGSEAVIEAVSAHIEQHIGEPSFVYHQMLSAYVHVDIHIVPPSEARPFTTLVTSGMSERPMAAPPELADECSRAELIIALPPEWPTEEPSLRDERNYWPFRLLQVLAALPHQYETWLWMGHTVPNGDPPEPYADDTSLCCAMLFPPLLTPDEFDVLETPSGPVTFLGVYPLYRSEMELKLEQGADALADRFEQARVTELLDRSRPSVA